MDSLRNALGNLNRIARENGGNRAFGFPGYEASMDFVLEQVADSYGDYFNTFIQPFNDTFSTTYHISVSGPDGELDDIGTVENNNPTPLPCGVTGRLAALPVDDERGSGCFKEQWTNLNGKIALVKRGGCAMGDKLKFAKETGAIGALVFNDAPGLDIEPASLDVEDYGSLAPVAVVTLEQGLDWKRRLDFNATIEVTLTVNATVEDRETWQIISETKQGDPDNIIMLGAHLDSVQEGPGVDDNGSGTVALLALATSIRKYDGLQNKVRFAWWGAEENGLVGSNYYVSQLSKEELDKIRFYLNFDMIASPKPRYYVHVDDDDDKTGGHFLYDYLVEQGYPGEWRYVDVDYDSLIPSLPSPAQTENKVSKKDSCS